MSGGRAARQKGRRWQTASRKWLRSVFGTGNVVEDGGSGLTTIGDFTVTLPDGRWLKIEARDRATFNLAGWVDEGADVPLYAVLIKRPRRPNVDDAYVVMSGHHFAALVGRREPF